MGDHLGSTVDLNIGMFRAPPDKLRHLAQQASSLFGRAASSARWLPARQLAPFAGKAQFLYLAIAPARLFLRELHNVLATRSGWGCGVRLTHKLRRDLEWWRTVNPCTHGMALRGIEPPLPGTELCALSKYRQKSVPDRNILCT
jgi:hypothetical protein